MEPGFGGRLRQLQLLRRRRMMVPRVHWVCTNVRWALAAFEKMQDQLLGVPLVVRNWHVQGSALSRRLAPQSLTGHAG
jgi:hypothetical protein